MNSGRRTTLVFLAGLFGAVVGCGRAQAPAGPPPTVSATEPVAIAPCRPSPVVPPEPPSDFPGYAQLNPATGLHVTALPPALDFANYRLAVTGKVDNPLRLTYDDLRCLPKVERRIDLVCPGTFVDTATWAGPSLREVLALAGVQGAAKNVTLASVDGYAPEITLAQALSEAAFLAYELEGQPLPVLHGFPVRAVFPGEVGALSTKWLGEIRIS